MATILALLQASWMGMPAWIWLSFIAIVLIILALDLGLFHREAHAPSLKESAILAGCCMTLGASFSVVVWWLYYTGQPTAYLDPQLAAAYSPENRAWTAWQLYLTGWVVEQTLSLDNVFVMSVIFSYFAIPRKYQHRVLFYGILGVIILRAIMIGVGAVLVHQFSWILFLFAAFLVFTGIKMLMSSDDAPDMENNPILLFMRRHMRITQGLHSQKFFVRQLDTRTGKMATFATPLFVALILIEIADVIFAVDSVPAIFALTQDPFIVYTSNIFAILGLRALYFVLAAMVHRFEYLKYALALVLIYIGGKVFAQELIGKISPEISLIVTFVLLGGGILFSLWKTSMEERKGS